MLLYLNNSKSLGFVFVVLGIKWVMSKMVHKSYNVGVLHPFPLVIGYGYGICFHYA